MTKKGPKGIVSPLSFFLPVNTSIKEITAPVKKATYNPIIVPGKPKNNPITPANFTSPNPIPLPRVIAKRAKNNINETIPAPKLANKLP